MMRKRTSGRLYDVDEMGLDGFIFVLFLLTITISIQTPTIQRNAVNDNQQDVCFGFYRVSSPLLAVSEKKRRDKSDRRLKGLTAWKTKGRP